MLLEFFFFVLAVAFRAALSPSRPLESARCSGGLSGVLYGQGSKKGGSNEPPIVGRFALSSVISTRRKIRDN